MSQSNPLDFELPQFEDHSVRAAGEDKQGIRLGLAVAGACLGGAVGLLAVLSAGIANDNPIGWLAVACSVAIGAVLGA